MKLNPDLVEFIADCISYNYDPDNSDAEFEYDRILTEFKTRTDGMRDSTAIKQVVHDICGSDPWFKHIKRELLTALNKAELCKNRRELERIIKYKIPSHLL